MRIVPDGQQLSGRVPGPSRHGTGPQVLPQAHGLQRRPAVSLHWRREVLADSKSGHRPPAISPHRGETVAILRLAGVVTGRCVVWVDRRSRDLSWVPRRSDEPGR